MFTSCQPSGKDDFLQWVHPRLQPGEKLLGWKCGPLVGVMCHWRGGTKACRRHITNKLLTCETCDEGEEPVYTGYLPFFESTGLKMVVPLGQSMREAADAICFGQGIKVFKPRTKTFSVIVKQEEWTQLPCPYIGRLKCQYDIRPFLLTLWKDKVLKDHFGLKPENIPISDIGDLDPPKGKGTADKDPTVLRLLSEQIGKFTGVTPDSESEDTIPRLKSSKNGKH